MAKKKKVKTKTEINSAIVKEYGINAGATVVGIATSEDFSQAPKGFKPDDALEGCQSVIVLGSPSPKEAFENSVLYTKDRNAMAKKMTTIAKELAKQIKNDGYKTKAISCIGGKYVNGEHFGIISLKHAAEFAGIGQITRNYLLTNPEYGNRLWFSSVLTDAELTPDKKIDLDICKDCNKCVESCPSGALDTPSSLEKKECSKYYKIVNRKLEIECFLCRTVCPYGLGEDELLIKK